MDLKQNRNLLISLGLAALIAVSVVFFVSSNPKENLASVPVSMPRDLRLVQANEAKLHLKDKQIEKLRTEVEEIHKLRAEVSELRRVKSDYEQFKKAHESVAATT